MFTDSVWQYNITSGFIFQRHGLNIDTASDTTEHPRTNIWLAVNQFQTIKNKYTVQTALIWMVEDQVQIKQLMIIIYIILTKKIDFVLCSTRIYYS